MRIPRPPAWVLWFAVLNTLLDLPIAGYVWHNSAQIESAQDRIEHIAAAAACWDHVLDKAVLTPPSPAQQAGLRTVALVCVSLDP